MLLAALALALATGDVVGELLRFPLPPPPPDPGWPSKCCECRSNPVDFPKFAKALGSADRTRRARAANELAGILKYCYEPKAVVLLSPWISNPLWADETNKDGRMVVIEHAGWEKVTEAVPTLIHALENDPSLEIRSAAAWSLALIDDPRAKPALRRALRLEGSKQAVVQALMKMDGFTEAELARGLEAYISGDPESDDALIGMMVAGNFERDDIAVEVVRAIDAERANTQVIVHAVMSPNELCKRAAPELALLRSRGGVRAGIAAAILGDHDGMQAILIGNDAEAIRALQAASRFRARR